MGLAPTYLFQKKKKTTKRNNFTSQLRAGGLVADLSYILIDISPIKKTIDLSTIKCDNKA